MRSRKGLSLLETLVVIGIVGVLLGMLLPVVQSTRLRALEVVCKNNVKQINLAVAQLLEGQRHLPAQPRTGLVGGWTIEVLPYLEQQNLRDRILPNTPIAPAPDFLVRRPAIMTCPVAAGADSTSGGAMERAHYLLSPDASRRGYRIFDAPRESNFPWASGPEMSFSVTIRRIGPHNGGFFYSGGLLLDSVHYTLGDLD
jgi:prepilin-type N-terminal cleavage/methylation domain-containing protein